MRFLKGSLRLAPVLLLVGVLLGLPTIAFGDDDRNNNEFRAVFLGINEVPSVSTEATASLRVKISGSGDDATIEYNLRYSGLRADATQSHIHFSQTKTNGGVVLFLCGTAASPGPAGTPTCGARSANITRTVSKADIIGGAAAQGIAAGEMARVVRAIRDGAAYGNVHSAMFPSGEARGQLRRD
jgi:CHRD domain